MALELAERPVTLQGSALARAVLCAFGWRLRFGGLPARQGVLIVYPHTSNWDLVVGLLAKWAIGFPVSFWGKDSLFAVPLLGRWMRWVGGVPVDRSDPRGVVEQMTGRMQRAKACDEFFWLAIAPEGTRSYTDHWRTGFYRVALNADVPVGLGFLDFLDKRVGVETFVRLSGDAQADMAAIASHLSHLRGCEPHLAAPIRLPNKEDTSA